MVSDDSNALIVLSQHTVLKVVAVLVMMVFFETMVLGPALVSVVASLAGPVFVVVVRLAPADYRFAAHRHTALALAPRRW